MAGGSWDDFLRELDRDDPPDRQHDVDQQVASTSGGKEQELQVYTMTFDLIRKPSFYAVSPMNDQLVLCVCKLCGMVLKRVAYGQHMRTRHGRGGGGSGSSSTVTSPVAETPPTELCREGVRTRRSREPDTTLTINDLPPTRKRRTRSKSPGAAAAVAVAAALLAPMAPTQPVSPSRLSVESSGGLKIKIRRTPTQSSPLEPSTSASGSPSSNSNPPRALTDYPSTTSTLAHDDSRSENSSTLSRARKRLTEAMTNSQQENGVRKGAAQKRKKVEVPRIRVDKEKQQRHKQQPPHHEEHDETSNSSTTTVTSMASSSAAHSSTPTPTPTPVAMQPVQQQQPPPSRPGMSEEERADMERRLRIEMAAVNEEMRLEVEREKEKERERRMAESRAAVQQQNQQQQQQQQKQYNSAMSALRSRLEAPVVAAAAVSLPPDSPLKGVEVVVDDEDVIWLHGEEEEKRRDPLLSQVHCRHSDAERRPQQMAHKVPQHDHPASSCAPATSHALAPSVSASTVYHQGGAVITVRTAAAGAHPNGVGVSVSGEERRPLPSNIRVRPMPVPVRVVRESDSSVQDGTGHSQLQPQQHRSPPKHIVTVYNLPPHSQAGGQAAGASMQQVQVQLQPQQQHQSQVQAGGGGGGGGGGQLLQGVQVVPHQIRLQPVQQGMQHHHQMPLVNSRRLQMVGGQQQQQQQWVTVTSSSGQLGAGAGGGGGVVYQTGGARPMMGAEQRQHHNYAAAGMGQPQLLHNHHQHVYREMHPRYATPSQSLDEQKRRQAEQLSQQQQQRRRPDPAEFRVTNPDEYERNRRAAFAERDAAIAERKRQASGGGGGAYYPSPQPSPSRQQQQQQPSHTIVVRDLDRQEQPPQSAQQQQQTVQVQQVQVTYHSPQPMLFQMPVSYQQVDSSGRAVPMQQQQQPQQSGHAQYAYVRLNPMPPQQQLHMLQQQQHPQLNPALVGRIVQPRILGQPRAAAVVVQQQRVVCQQHPSPAQHQQHQQHQMVEARPAAALNGVAHGMQQGQASRLPPAAEEETSAPPPPLLEPEGMDCAGAGGGAGGGGDEPTTRDSSISPMPVLGEEPMLGELSDPLAHLRDAPPLDAPPFMLCEDGNGNMQGGAGGGGGENGLHPVLHRRAMPLEQPSFLCPREPREIAPRASSVSSRRTSPSRARSSPASCCASPFQEEEEEEAAAAEPRVPVRPPPTSHNYAHYVSHTTRRINGDRCRYRLVARSDERSGASVNGEAVDGEGAEHVEAGPPTAQQLFTHLPVDVQKYLHGEGGSMRWDRIEEIEFMRSLPQIWSAEIREKVREWHEETWLARIDTRIRKMRRWHDVVKSTSGVRLSLNEEKLCRLVEHLFKDLDEPGRMRFFSRMFRVTDLAELWKDREDYVRTASFATLLLLESLRQCDPVMIAARVDGGKRSPDRRNSFVRARFRRQKYVEEAEQRERNPRLPPLHPPTPPNQLPRDVLPYRIHHGQGQFFINEPLEDKAIWRVFQRAFRKELVSNRRSYVRDSMEMDAVRRAFLASPGGQRVDKWLATAYQWPENAFGFHEPASTFFLPFRGQMVKWGVFRPLRGGIDPQLKVLELYDMHKMEQYQVTHTEQRHRPVKCNLVKASDSDRRAHMLAMAKRIKENRAVSEAQRTRLAPFVHVDALAPDSLVKRADVERESVAARVRVPGVNADWDWDPPVGETLYAALPLSRVYDCLREPVSKWKYIAWSCTTRPPYVDSDLTRYWPVEGPGGGNALRVSRFPDNAPRPTITTLHGQPHMDKWIHVDGDVVSESLVLDRVAMRDVLGYEERRERVENAPPPPPPAETAWFDRMGVDDFGAIQQTGSVFERSLLAEPGPSSMLLPPESPMSSDEMLALLDEE